MSGRSIRRLFFTAILGKKKVAEASRGKLANSGQHNKPIATLIKPAGRFWPAEEEHQRYLEKHPGGYCHLE